jgi:transposase-like protein
VLRAKQMHSRGATVRDLARRFDVHASTMSRALRGLTFGHVRGAARKKTARKR